VTRGPTVTRRRLAFAGGLTIVMLAGLGAIATDRHQAAGSTDQAILEVAARPAPASGKPATPTASASSTTEPVVVPAVPPLPSGGTRVFGRHRFLVAYYGTAATAALGVLGEAAPDEMQRRLRKAAQPFKQEGERIQSVYELIVTVADAGPGTDGDYSHDIAASHVRDYIEAAHRNGALVVLDLQPGRADFLTVAKRWRWALEDPWVGLALDPEWRMGPRQVPGRVIGSVGAAEVNRVSSWLARLVRREHLPEKPFVLHQFRTTMIRDIADVAARPGLAMVQHADGFGTQAQKLATYHAIARPAQFAMGFKLFYDEDVHRFTPAQVRRIRPVVRFVSFQ
jgi:hypothetical protein